MMFADGHARIERAERVLKNHLDSAAVVFERIAARAGDIHATKALSIPAVDFSNRNSVRPTVDLAAAGFADQAERFHL